MDLSGKKSDYLTAVEALAEQLLHVTRQAEEMALWRSDMEFAPGAANAIVDADCVGNNAHMTAAIADAAVTTLNSMANTHMTLPRRTTLRKAIRTPMR